MATDFLTANEKAMITNDVSDLTSDTQISVAVTYQAFTSRGAFDPTTGQVVETYTESSIRAIRVPIGAREVAASNGMFQVGDYRYFIRSADVATPKKDDRIVDGSDTRYVVSFSTDPLGVFHAVVARSLG